MHVKRKLGVRDLMPMVRIISKIHVSDFKECFSSETVKKVLGKKENLADQKAKCMALTENNVSAEDDSQEQDIRSKIEAVGFEVAMNAADVLLRNIPLIETDLYSFLASMCDMTLEDYMELPPSALIVTLREVFGSEEAQDFFMEVARLVNWDSNSGTSSTEDMQPQISS